MLKTPSEIAAEIKALKEKLNLAEKQMIQIRIDIADSISKLTAQCSHEHTEKIHSSSGNYWQQSINCLDCEQILQKGQHLFPPSKADRSHSHGN